MAEKKVEVETPTDETDELKQKFERRQKINAGEMEPENKVVVRSNSLGIYYDNPDMDKVTIDSIKAKFDEFDLDKNGVLDEYELTLLFEKLKVPNNVFAVRNFIKEADQDGDNCLNINEFIAVFKKVAAGKLDDSSSLWALAQLTEIDVSEVKVSGAVNFFEAQARKVSDTSFANMMEMEKLRKKAEEEEKERARARFAERKKQFEQQ